MAGGFWSFADASGSDADFGSVRTESLCDSSGGSGFVVAGSVGTGFEGKSPILLGGGDVGLMVDCGVGEMAGLAAAAGGFCGSTLRFVSHSSRNEAGPDFGVAARPKSVDGDAAVPIPFGAPADDGAQAEDGAPPKRGGKPP